MNKNHKKEVINCFSDCHWSKRDRWLGLYDNGSKNVFHDDWAWTDGSSTQNYSNWYSQLPVDGYRCAVMGVNGQWYKKPCDVSLKFICKSGMLQLKSYKHQSAKSYKI